MKKCIQRYSGMSLVEVIIAVAVTSILVAISMPSYVDQVIRDKVDTSMSLAASAQEALIKTCDANGDAVVNNNLEAGFFYIPGGPEDGYVSRILLGAECAKEFMVIVMWTGNTGASQDPILELSANGLGSEATWTCRVIRGELRHVPDACRNRYKSI